MSAGARSKKMGEKRGNASDRTSLALDLPAFETFPALWCQLWIVQTVQPILFPVIKIMQLAYTGGLQFN